MKDYPSELSPREQRVYLGIARGDSPGAIASQMGVAKKTVATYRERVKEKLGLRSNAAIAVDAERRGLLTEEKANDDSIDEQIGASGSSNDAVGGNSKGSEDSLPDSGA